MRCFGIRRHRKQIHYLVRRRISLNGENTRRRSIQLLPRGFQRVTPMVISTRAIHSQRYRRRIRGYNHLNSLAATCRNLLVRINKRYRQGAAVIITDNHPERDIIIAACLGRTLVDALGKRRSRIQLARSRNAARSADTGVDAHIGLLQRGAIQREHVVVVPQFAERVGGQVEHTRKHDKRRRKSCLVVASRQSLVVLVLGFQGHAQLRGHRNIVRIRSIRRSRGLFFFTRRRSRRITATTRASATSATTNSTVVRAYNARSRQVIYQLLVVRERGRLQLAKASAGFRRCIDSSGQIELVTRTDVTLRVDEVIRNRHVVERVGPLFQVQENRGAFCCWRKFRIERVLGDNDELTI